VVKADALQYIGFGVIKIGTTFRGPSEAFVLFKDPTLDNGLDSVYGLGDKVISSLQASLKIYSKEEQVWVLGLLDNFKDLVKTAKEQIKSEMGYPLPFIDTPLTVQDYDSKSANYQVGLKAKTSFYTTLENLYIRALGSTFYL
jgi:hypothetical protein